MPGDFAAPILIYCRDFSPYSIALSRADDFERGRAPRIAPPMRQEFTPQPPSMRRAALSHDRSYTGHEALEVSAHTQFARLCHAYLIY